MFIQAKEMSNCHVYTRTVKWSIESSS